MSSSRRRVATTVLLALVTAPVIAAASPATASAGVHCDPNYKRTYTYQSWAWDELDSGVIKNKSRATVKKTRHHSSNETTTTTVTGGAGLTVKLAVVEINGKFEYAVSKSASYSKGESIEITVPPRSSVRWESGLIKRKFKVRIKQTFSNCDTRTTTAYVYAAEERDVVKDI